MKDKKKHLIIVSVIAIVVAIVSLCSVVLFGNNGMSDVELSEIAGGEQTAETAREIVIEDTTFTSGTLTVQSGSNVTIRNCTFTGITTGAIYVKTDATLNLEDCNFVNNTKAQGGGAAVHIDGSTVNINNCVFDNNKTSTVDSTSWKGGAIFSRNSTINISNSSFVNNVAASYGGALAFNTNSTVKILGGVTIGSCRASYGGGISLENDSKLTISGDNVIKNCSATYNGGAIWNSSGKLTIEDCEIIGNTAKRSCGGGIWNDGGEVIINSCTISDNIADYNGKGGAIYISNSGTFTMNGGNISGNTVTTGFGGGIYVYSGTFTMNGGSISENTATNHGGGVYVSSSSTYIINEGSIFDNTANLGGGVYVNGGTINHTGGVIGGDAVSDGNTATNGGGVYIYSGTYNLNGGHVSGNTATNNGGGIYNSANLNTSGWCEIMSNTAKNGGGIASEGGSILIKETLLYLNEATNVGGGIYTVTSTSSTFELNNSELYDNSAYRGGGIYHSAGFDFYITGSTVIDSNNASNHGGGVYVNKGSLYLGSPDLPFNGEIGANRAGSYGGAIFSYGNVYQYGGCIGPGASCYSGNTASVGGGVHIRSGKYVMFGGRIEGNTSTKQGGGIYAGATGVLTISGGTVFKNTSSTNGGGICHESSGEFVISGTANIVGNSASDSGGGIYVGSGTVHVGKTGSDFSGLITGNAANNGGGIYVVGGTLNHNSGLIGGEYKYNSTTYTGNTATTSGGGVYVNSSGTCNLNGGNVSQNSASSGGGVYVTTSATLSVNGCEISANSGTEGGGIFGTGATISLTSATISNNTAQNGGGVFVNKSSVLAVSSCTISNNMIGITSGVVYGAGICSYYSEISVGGNTTISNNGKLDFDEYDSSTVYGGGIYSAGATSFVIDGSGVEISSNNAHRGAGVMITNQTSQISDCVISNNTASNLGGGFYAAGGNTIFAGVVVEGNSSDYGGGGIHLHRATFEFTDTKINENYALSHGAGIGTSSATIVMNDGSEVKGNKINPTIEEESFSGRGAGVLVYGGTMTMNGGVISENEVNENCKRRLGSGVYVSDGGLFTLNAGTISNNKFLGNVSMPSYGANVYVKSEADTVNSDGTFTILDATFVMNGGTISGDGTAQATLGTGIFSSSVVDINGGEILNCIAEKAGGAIAHFGTSFSIGEVTISGCGAPCGESIISGDKIVVDGEFSGVSGTIALGTSELYGVVSNDELLDEGSFVNPMRTASIFENFETTKAYTYQLEFFAYVQSFDAGIDNCVYDLMDDESHMKAFYLEDFSESGYTTHTDYYLLKFTTNNSGRTCEMVSSEEDYSFKLYEEVDTNTDGYRLNPYKTFTVKVYYYDENYDYQFVEWEVVEGTYLGEGEYINQLGYYDENG
ncbi:MAG: right-handed parallel beta-helix repeat-containing protein, partial [Clostridia bacterium]|nr:right-handed parallel beta-helix repeat-containing protein [Clostridia bacterium]